MHFLVIRDVWPKAGGQLLVLVSWARFVDGEPVTSEHEVTCAWPDTRPSLRANLGPAIRDLLQSEPGGPTSIDELIILGV